MNDVQESDQIRRIIASMTLEEKISQMCYLSPSVERLGIPAYAWWNEALHGAARAGVATVFPQVIGLAASFDPDLVRRVADTIAEEVRAKYHEFVRQGDRGLYKGLTIWAPNINIFRDPRWGRGHETYGEDPFLTAELGIAYIQGLQGEDPDNLKCAACLKHYAVHSGPEGERHSFDARVGKKDLFETYLYAFRECIRRTDVEAVMGAYNRTNGEPCCGSGYLLQQVLREKFGFEGHVVSDCWAVRDFHAEHGVTAGPVESAALAVNSGCDLNCGNTFPHLIEAVGSGLVSEERIDQAVGRLFRTRQKLGILTSGSTDRYTRIPYAVNDCTAHHDLAIEAAERSIVLLRNREGLLPLSPNLRAVAVIGPNADDREVLCANYSGTASRYCTPLEGIREMAGEGTRIFYAPGCEIQADRTEALAEAGDRISEAVSAALQADVALVFLGLNAQFEGEQGDTGNSEAGGDKVDLRLPGLQLELLRRVYATGTPTVLVLLAGSAVDLNWADENIPAILHAWYPGALGGRAIAGAVFGEFSPSGRLPVTFYRDLEDLPLFSDYSMHNRTYRYFAGEALYPFGFGLGYGRIEYKELNSDGTEIDPDRTLRVTVTVENIGETQSRATAQLYISGPEGPPAAPLFQLRGIRSVELAAGEARDLAFDLTVRDFARVDDDGECRLDPGSYAFYVGGSQPDERSCRLTGVRPQRLDLRYNGKSIMVEC